jgi:hypothetical protein
MKDDLTIRSYENTPPRLDMNARPLYHLQLLQAPFASRLRHAACDEGTACCLDSSRDSQAHVPCYMESECGRLDSVAMRRAAITSSAYGTD